MIPAISTRPTPPARPRRLIPAHGTPAGNAKRILLVARQLRPTIAADASLPDRAEALKCRCAALHLAYDSAVIGAAIAFVHPTPESRR